MAELQRAEKINAFNVYLLGQAVPGGKPVAIHDILARAERLVDKRFAGDETVAVELRTTIGGIYAIRDEDAEARRILKRAYEASQRLADPMVRAEAACNWARLVAEDGDYTAGLRLVDSALAPTTRAARFTNVVAGCLVVKSNIATDAGLPGVAVESAQQALARVQDTPEAVLPEARVDALEALALGRSGQGDTEGANRLYAQVLALLQQTGLEDTTDAGVVLHNWALNAALTSPLQALDMHRRMIAIFEGGDPDAVPMPGPLNYGIELNRLARYAEARTVHEAVRAQARRQENPTMLALAGLGLARACRELGDLACARGALRESANVLRPFPSEHRALADLVREQGLLAAAEGDLAGAHRLLASALAIHEKVPEKHVSHIETLLALARLELGGGDAFAAEAHARAALSLARALRGGAPQSAWVGLSQLALGEVLEARQDAASARWSFLEAVGQMAITLGDAHPAMAEARSHLGRLGPPG
jgi:tetratricopeptide (TPR) repeat protein